MDTNANRFAIRPAQYRGQGNASKTAHSRGGFSGASKGLYLGVARRHGAVRSGEGKSAGRGTRAIQLSASVGQPTRNHPSFYHRPQTPPDGHFYLRNGVLQPLSHQTRESDSSPDTGGKGPRRQLATKTVNKKATQAWRRHLDHSSDEDESESEHGSPVREIITISSDSEASDSASLKSQNDNSALLAALGVLTVPARIWQDRTLPFLMRNLRPCFRDYCHIQGIPTTPKTVPETELHVIYRYRNMDHDWEDHDGSTSDWRCPLCNFHGIFNTREMLEYHVQRDHDEVETTWSRSEESGQREEWTLSIQWSYQQTSDVSQLAVAVNNSAQETKTRPQPTQGTRIEREHSPDLNVQMSNVAITQQDDLPRLKCEEPDTNVPTSIFGPLMEHTSSAGPVLTVESDTGPPLPRRKPLTGISENGQLIPPPKENKWGPAAEPPLESCRPEGPRIYDLLKELPLTDFGVYAWTIIDREEDLFEQEDLADEEKVMLALWNRWIMVNRVKFLREKKGDRVLSFIDEYYPMIHRAAGWHALRLFLLMLHANKFLTISAVLRTMKSYEEKVGMSTWYASESEDNADSQ